MTQATQRYVNGGHSPPYPLLRVLIDGAGDGAKNMAVDDAILRAVDKGESPATLRFYQWSEPTISLGYFQKVSEWQNQEEPVRQPAMVRRQTGGGAILHDDELTYSLTLPMTFGERFVGIESMVRLVHDGFLASIRKQGLPGRYRGGRHTHQHRGGPFFCNERAHALDVMLAGEKVLGSSQRRMRHGCLQHGSMVPGRHSSRLIGGDSPLHQLMDDVAEYIGKQLSLRVRRGRLSQAEQQGTEQLLAKYGSKDWNYQR